MENDRLHQIANEIADDAQATGSHLANVATHQMDTAFQQTLTENVVLWADRYCPDDYDQAGKLAGRLVNAGRRQAALEVLLYSVSVFAFVAAGLWLINAAGWLYIPAVAGSMAFGLYLALSGNN
ncbi:hypothetical protein Lepto7375DRAFT_1785 [Leptolyngbya sp. PCC 7375]|nr:hypothetical protein Lepto7375DRAFT_1785 [Leptolyngbya sp. PCC 7375]